MTIHEILPKIANHTITCLCSLFSLIFSKVIDPLNLVQER